MPLHEAASDFSVGASEIHALPEGSKPYFEAMLRGICEVRTGLANLKETFIWFFWDVETNTPS